MNSTSIFFIYNVSLRPDLSVLICVCLKKAGPLNVFLNKLCSRKKPTKVGMVQKFKNSPVFKELKELWSPHDEVEPNLKKTHHRNGIWGLEAIVM